MQRPSSVLLRIAPFVVPFVLVGTWHAGAQTWPTRPVHAIVAFAAGSATDIVPRVVFEPLGAQLGQPIVVENRGGAGTTIAGAVVAKADPDGYTLLATSSAHTLVPTVYPNAPYDTAADFAAVVSLGSSPNVLVVSPARGLNRERIPGRRPVYRKQRPDIGATMAKVLKK